MPLTRNLLTRRLVQALTALALVAVWPSVQAEEYFDNQRAKPFTAGAAVGADATVGGYAIYPGDRDWRFLRVGGGWPEPVWRGLRDTHADQSGPGRFFRPDVGHHQPRAVPGRFLPDG